MAVDSEGISDREKCIRQLAQSAAKNVKYHSSQSKASQFIAGNATEKRKLSNSLSISRTI